MKREKWATLDYPALREWRERPDPRAPMGRRARGANAAPPATPEMPAVKEYGVTKVQRDFPDGLGHPESPVSTACTGTPASMAAMGAREKLDPGVTRDIRDHGDL